MSDSGKRVIVLGDDVEEAIIGQLVEALGEGTALQNQAAASCAPVLELTGQWQRHDRTLVIEHEPADAFGLAEFFDADMPPTPGDELLAYTAALLDALQAIRVSRRGQRPSLPTVHGGLCPGVLLRDLDGGLKVADFGVAPAICRVLGPDAYLNLAVNPAPGDPYGEEVTAVWEVLTPEDVTRADRLCGFIDPDKYARGTLSTFEAGSDVIAAGFLLHLLTEHVHPYFFDEPEALRVPEMSAQMGAFFVTPLQREDLCDSGDEGTRTWLEMMGSMISVLPQERPSAETALQKLQPFVKVADPVEVANRRLVTARAHLEQHHWKPAERLARQVANNDRLPGDLRDQGAALAAEIQASMQLVDATSYLNTADWPKAAALLRDLLEVGDLPESVRGQATDAQRIVMYNDDMLRSFQRYTELSTATEPGDSPSVREALAELDHATRDDLLPDVLTRFDEVRIAVRQRLAELIEAEEEAERARREAEDRARHAAIAADHKTAEEWFAGARAALEQQDYEALDGILQQQPALTHWPDAVRQELEQARARLAAHHKAEQLRAERDADRQRAAAWLEPLTRAAKNEDWDAVGERLHEKPELRYWPPEVLEGADAIAVRHRAVLEERERQRQVAADADVARQWVGQVTDAVQRGDWDEAARQVARRPELTYWPDEVEAQEAALRAQIDHAEGRRALERERIAEEHRRAQTWLTELQAHVAAEAWDEGAALAEKRPRIRDWPKGVEEEGNNLAERCLAELEKLAVQRRAVLSDAAATAAREFIAELIKERLGSLLDPRAVNVDHEPPTWELEDDHGHGAIGIQVGVRGEDTIPIDKSLALEVVHWRPTVADPDERVAGNLADQLRERLRRVQQGALQRYGDEWKTSLFPDAQVTAKLGDPSARLEAVVHLRGSDHRGGDVHTSLIWDPIKLQWELEDATALGNRCTEIATRNGAAAGRDKILATSETLGQYRKLLTCKLLPNPKPPPGTIPTELNLTGTLTIKPPQGSQAGQFVRLGEFSARYDPTGTTITQGDPQAAVAALNALLTVDQQMALDDARQTVKEKLNGVRAKVKCEFDPPHIKKLVEHVTLRLSEPSIEKPLTLTCGWDPQAYDFARGRVWEQQVDDFLEPFRPKEGAVGKARRPAWAVPVAVAAAVALSVGGYLVFGPQRQRASSGRTVIRHPLSPEQRRRAFDEVRALVRSAAEAPTLAAFLPPAMVIADVDKTGARYNEPNQTLEVPTRVALAADGAALAPTFSNGLTALVDTTSNGAHIENGEEVRAAATELLYRRLITRQQDALTEEARRLAGGLFPNIRVTLDGAEVSAALGAPVTSATPSMVLRDDDDAVDVPMTWDPEGLRFVTDDPPSFVRSALHWVRNTVRTASQEELDAAEGVLATHRQIVTVGEVQIAGDTPDSELPDAVGLHVPILLNIEGAEQPKQLYKAEFHMPGGEWAISTTDVEDIGNILTKLARQRQREALLRIKEYLDGCLLQACPAIELPVKATPLPDEGLLAEAFMAISRKDQVLWRQTYPWVPARLDFDAPSACPPNWAALCANPWVALVRKAPFRAALLTELNKLPTSTGHWMAGWPQARFTYANPQAAPADLALEIRYPWADAGLREATPVSLQIRINADELASTLSDVPTGGNEDQAAKQACHTIDREYFRNNEMRYQWPLVVDFVALSEDASFLNSPDNEAFAAIRTMSKSYRDLRKPFREYERFLRQRPPRSQSRIETRMEVVSATLESTPSTRLAVGLRGRWMLVPDQRASRWFDVTKLNGQIAGTIPSVEGTLRLVAHSDVGWWEGVNDFGALAGPLAELLKRHGRLLAPLEDVLAHLEQREEAEANLHDALPADAASAGISADQAYQLMTRIWAAKGVAETLPADFNGLLQRLAAPWHGRPTEVHPTVFVEYFWGHHHVYAIVWSVAMHSQPPVRDGPTIVRLADTAQLLPHLSPDAANRDAAIVAEALIDSVLRHAPKGVEGIDGTLGLVLALDGPLRLVGDLRALPIPTRRTSTLFETKVAETGIGVSITWDRLDDLLKRSAHQNLRCSWWVADNILERGRNNPDTIQARPHLRILLDAFLPEDPARE